MFDELQHAFSINSLVAWYNLAENTQSVHNQQGIVVVMTLGSVNEVHIQQCIDHVWLWQDAKYPWVAGLVPVARDTLLACPMHVLHSLCQLCVRYASVEHLLESPEPGIRLGMTDNIVGPL